METKLTEVWLDEEGVGAALSTCEVDGAGEEARRRASVVHGLARGGTGGVRDVLRKLRARLIEEWWSVKGEIGARRWNGQWRRWLGASVEMRRRGVKWNRGYALKAEGSFVR